MSRLLTVNIFIVTYFLLKMVCIGVSFNKVNKVTKKCNSTAAHLLLFLPQAILQILDDVIRGGGGT